MVDEVTDHGAAVFAHVTGGQVLISGRRDVPGQPAQAPGGDLA
jgi:hypothetical protein